MEKPVAEENEEMSVQEDSEFDDTDNDDYTEYSEVIECETKSDIAAPLTIGGIVLIFSWSSGILGLVPLAFQEEFSWIGLAVFIVPLFIFGCILWGVYCHLRWKKYGQSRIRIPEKVGRIGGVLKGTLTTTSEVKTTGDYLFKLVCKESRTVKTSKGDKSVSKEIWSETITVRSQGYRSRTGIPFEFHIPSDCNASLYTGSPRYDWELTVSAPARGINYRSNYRVYILSKDAEVK